MDKQTDALKLALEALEWINRVNAMEYEYKQKARESLNAIYDALAEQPVQQQAYEQANPLGGPAKVFQAMANAIRAGDDYHAVLRQYGYAEAQQQEPGAYDKTEINCFAQDLYDQKMREGKRGHYESMFHVIHQCIKKVSPQPSKPLTDEEIKRLKPISADFVSFRAGVRCMEREYRIGEKR